MSYRRAKTLEGSIGLGDFSYNPLDVERKNRDAEKDIHIKAEKERARLGLPSQSIRIGPSNDVSPDPTKNCCKCGFQRIRTGIAWHKAYYPTDCTVCGSRICTFCTIGMLKFKPEDCNSFKQLQLREKAKQQKIIDHQQKIIKEQEARLADL